LDRANEWINQSIINLLAIAAAGSSSSVWINQSIYQMTIDSFIRWLIYSYSWLIDSIHSFEIRFSHLQAIYWINRLTQLNSTRLDAKMIAVSTVERERESTHRTHLWYRIVLAVSIQHQKRCTSSTVLYSTVVVSFCIICRRINESFTNYDFIIFQFILNVSDERRILVHCTLYVLKEKSRGACSCILLNWKTSVVPLKVIE